ncbi:MAG TPA: serine hydrolase domain-containing protein [Candidatus Dormibacteraeota bacterium]
MALEVTAVRGYTAPSFESVAGAAERALLERGEEGLAVAAYLRGEKVVDIWAGTADGRPWSEDTLAVIFSCTKGVLALCAQLLYDRGLLDIEAPVTRYWPEYGVNGKESTTVRHLLTHQAGVITFPRYWDVIGLNGEGLEDWELITRKLAEAPPSFAPGTQTLYHALTMGFLVGEVIRRIDGRTPGRLFADEVAGPLGLDVYIGIPPEAEGRAASVLPPPVVDKSALTPDQLRIKEMYEAMGAGARAALRAGKAIELEALPYAAGFVHPDRADTDSHLVDLLNRPEIRRAELPAGNGIATARGLARMYAMLTEGGELEGTRIVSPASIEVFNTPAVMMRPDLPAICLGYHRMVPLFKGPSATAFGHGGAGGSLAFADLERGLSFGFVHNRMRNEPVGTAADLVRAVYECLDSA